MDMLVETERLRLRSLADSDRAEWIELHRRSEDHLRPWSPLVAGSLDDQFDRALAKVSDQNRYMRGVGVLGDGSIAGLFNLNEIVRGVFLNAYASWLLAEQHTGQGYATEGVSALLDMAFSTLHGLGLHRVQANIMPENGSSIRLAERVGMRREGLAKRYLEIAGSWRDHIMYAKTAEEHTLRYLD